MLTDVQKELLNFITESAREAITKARTATGPAAVELRREAEELMAIRANMLGRFWTLQDEGQLELPLAA